VTTTGWKLKVGLKKSFLAGSDDGDGRMRDSATKIGRSRSWPPHSNDCWPFARAYVTLLRERFKSD
jgi:hypothetical protein